MSLKERDKKHLWHPLTQHRLQSDHIPIVKAQGCILYDENGKETLWYSVFYDSYEFEEINNHGRRRSKKINF